MAVYEQSHDIHTADAAEKCTLCLKKNYNVLFLHKSQKLKLIIPTDFCMMTDKRLYLALLTVNILVCF